jgi:hypothetical protein
MGPVGYENKFDLSLGLFYRKYIDFEKLISNKKYIKKMQFEYEKLLVRICKATYLK